MKHTHTHTTRKWTVITRNGLNENGINFIICMYLYHVNVFAYCACCVGLFCFLLRPFAISFSLDFSSLFAFTWLLFSFEFVYASFFLFTLRSDVVAHIIMFAHKFPIISQCISTNCILCCEHHNSSFSSFVLDASKITHLRTLTACDIPHSNLNDHLVLLFASVLHNFILFCSLASSHAAFVDHEIHFPIQWFSTTR